MNKNDNILGKNIKNLRLKFKLTQAALAELVAVEPKHISCVESGTSLPSLDLVKRFCNVFNVEIFELFLDESVFNVSCCKNEILNSIENFDDDKIKKLFLYCMYLKNM